MSEVSFERVTTNGINLNCAVAGDGPILFLLHGFPEFWRCWEHQIPELSRHFRVVVPDIRGFADSDKPCFGYGARSTASDIYGLIRHFCGNKRARVAGHDFGGYATWALSYLRPESLERITVLNSPHPWMTLMKLFTTDQIFKFWYVMFFQVPAIAEWWLRRQEGAGVESVMRKGSNNFDFPRDYMDALRSNILEDGAAQSGLEWYRAMARAGFTGPRFMRGTTDVPVQVIWGTADPALSEQLTVGLGEYAPHHRIDLLEGIGHYVTHEAPKRVTGLILDWMKD